MGVGLARGGAGLRELIFARRHPGLLQLHRRSRLSRFRYEILHLTLQRQLFRSTLNKGTFSHTWQQGHV